MAITSPPSGNKRKLIDKPDVKRPAPLAGGNRANSKWQRQISTKERSRRQTKLSRAVLIAARLAAVGASVTETRPNVWMPLYVGDYLRDTGRLMTEQHGAYLLLIFDYWSTGQPLPDDDVQLAAITRLSTGKWKQLRPVVARFFHVADGVWRHKRVDQELAKAQAITDARRAGGKKGAEKRWGSARETDSSGIGDPLGEPQVSHCVNQWPMHAQSQSQSQSQSLCSLRSQRARETDCAFADWWREYPNKVGKPDARKKYGVALARASAGELLEGLRRYISTKPPDRQWCNPATWLHQERWRDEPALPPTDRGRARTSILEEIAEIRFPGEEET